MSSSDFIIKKESDNIDLEVSNIKSLYPIKGKFKKRQKGSSGALIPFESIDKLLYNDNANCTCFTTSENRIHFWIKALAEIIWVQASDVYETIRRDRKENNNDHIIQTEFIISEKQSNVKDNEDDFLYKVIVYLSTGKVMIQGKDWQHFGDHIFEKCLQHIERVIDNQDQTSLKEGLSSPLACSKVSSGQDKNVQNINNSATTTKTATDTDVQKKSSIPKQTTDDDPKQQSVEFIINKLLNPIVNSMSVLEEAVVDIKSSVSNLLVNNQDYKDVITKELKNLGKTFNQSPTNLSNNMLEKQLKEKNDEVKKLTQKVEDMSKMYEKQCIKLQTEFAKKEERILEKVEEVNKLRDIAISDNEKLAIIVNLKEEKQTDLNHEFQNKLDEKDKMITALQDRIQNYLYDVNGDPWCKKVDNLNKRKEKESITGTNNISMNEIQTINSQSVPNDEAYNQKEMKKKKV
ncbi:Hypothetical predicted protein [Mytilus galloprovincialis]|uniref:Uncharacterized protein n=1 Tax=Mytilus galloprovincialis TaxID=29158 RepID=A0A8B6DEU7_MYTGA|nr:Hypothetical predicted protein [Mytilus galloprovincialis]